MNKLILTYVMICVWFCPSIRVWREGRWTCHFGVVLSFSDRGRVKGTRGHVPPGAHMEGKDPSAFSRQAPALHARRKWPMHQCMYEQCRRGAARFRSPTPTSQISMRYTWPRWRAQSSYVYGVPYPQTTTAYVRIPFKRRERGACRFVALRTCSLVL
jgi:hypothetical protein